MMTQNFYASICPNSEMMTDSTENSLLMSKLRSGVTDITSDEVDETEPLSQMLLNSHSPVVLSCLESGEAMFADMVSVVNPSVGVVNRKTRIRPVGVLGATEPGYVSRFEVERYLLSVERQH